MPSSHRTTVTTLATLALLAAPPALAQDCALPRLNTHGVSPADSVMHGDFAYIACQNGLQVIALTGADAMDQIDLIPLDRVRQVVREDDVLGVLSVDDRISLHLFDVAAPAAPELLASLDIGPSAPGVVTLDMSDGLALICGNRQMFVVDASEPAAPTLESVVDIAPFEFETHGVLAGDTAVVFAGARAESFDLADPSNPLPLASIDWPTIGAAVAGEGVVFTVDGPTLSVMGVADPADPQLIGSLDIAPSQASGGDLALEGDSLAIATSSVDYRMLLIDVSVPELPVLLSEGFGQTAPAFGASVAIDGGRALLMNWSRSQLLDITAPSAPALIAEGLSSAMPRGGDIDNDVMVASAGRQVEFYSVRSDGTFEHAANVSGDSLAIPFNQDSVSISGHRAAVARQHLQSGLRIELYDIADPKKPVLLAATPLPVSQYSHCRVTWIGEAVYVVFASSTNFFYVLDASAPAMPIVDSRFFTDAAYIAAGDLAYSLKLDGSVTAYDATDPFHLAVLGVSDPISPSPGLGRWASIAVEDNRAYLNGSTSIAVVDVSDPTNMTLLGESAMGPRLQNTIAVKDSIVYVEEDADLRAADDGPFMLAIDASDPLHPTTIARQSSPSHGSAGGLLPTPRGLLIASQTLTLLDFVACPCPADLDGDGQVGFSDLNLVISAFNTAPGDPNYNPGADTNGDSQIDFADLNLVLSAFNTGC